MYPIWNETGFFIKYPLRYLFDSAFFIRKRIRRARESYPAEDFFAQILLFKANACIIRLLFAAKANIGRYTIMHRAKKKRYLHFCAATLRPFLTCTISSQCLPQLRYSNSVRDICHYDLHSISREYPRSFWRD